MNRTEKYTRYFIAQADGELPKQRGGMLGTVLTLNKAMDWVNKFCDIAATRVISPVEQVNERVKSQIEQESEIKEAAKTTTPHKQKRRQRKRTLERQALAGHSLLKKLRRK